MFYQDAAAPRRFLVTDINGTPANCTLMVYTVTLPDGTVQTTTPVTPFATGDYRVNAPTSQAGRYSERWVGTGSNFTAKSNQYDVRSSVPVSLLSLEDAKAILTVEATDYTQDDKIADKLDAATDLIESVIGYVVPRAVTSTVVLSGSAFFLPGPVISVTSITPILTNGWAYTAVDFTAETSGLVTRLDGARLSGQAYTVVYQAGRPGPIEPRYLEAARLQLQILWETQRGRLWPGDGTPEVPDQPSGIDPRVYALLQRDRIVSVA